MGVIKIPYETIKLFGISFKRMKAPILMKITIALSVISFILKWLNIRITFSTREEKERGGRGVRVGGYSSNHKHIAHNIAIDAEGARGIEADRINDIIDAISMASCLIEAPGVFFFSLSLKRYSIFQDLIFEVVL